LEIVFRTIKFTLNEADMMKFVLWIIPLLLSLNCFAAETKPNSTTDVIKVNAGGKIFLMSRDTLCNYSDSSLGKMFSKECLFNASTVINDGYFLDDDPYAVENIFYFLRYNKIVFRDLYDAKRTRPVADKLCFDMVPAIDEWIKENIKPKLVAPKLIAIKAPSAKDQMLWYLARKSDEKIIGSKYGSVHLSTIKKLINERNNRSQNKDLVYAWSGMGYYIYNVETLKRIGEKFDDWEKHPYVNDFNKLCGLQLIETAIKEAKGRYYLCTFNDEGKFSIFRARTGYKEHTQSFNDHNSCMDKMLQLIREESL
jgi:hypothetical protein